MQKPKVNKCVLAYSGGLDTSAIVAWLRENYGCEVICVTADLGQKEELSGLEEKALRSGASKIYIEDLRQEFLEEYVFPTLKAGAIYEREYLLGTSFARPVIAKRMVEIARAEGADAVAHGCTGKGNDQVRFELTFKALNPRLTVIAPWREWEIRSREDAIAYCTARNIPISQSKRSIYSRDRNIWHISHEGGILEDPWQEPEEEMYTLTVAPEQAPDTPEYLDVAFESGVPVALNGERLGAVALVERLNELGGRHGIGRVDMVENRLVGIKSRGIYETPGGTILYRALSGLEQLMLDGETMHYKDLMAQKYAEMVYYGRWFTPLREALDAAMNVLAEPVTGITRVKLFKGHCTLVGRQSPNSLYREDFATFGEDSVYDQSDAEGFINLYGLSMKVRALAREPKAGQETA
ncbi:MAG: argininosuccinate synthase [Anaerolineae bacterium]|jgi:argininosuccinate synthase|nr:argininosuccinate synthase [Chloroflexota bacterium]